MKTIQLKSPAKLNLYLDCLYKRSDGFHQIQTIFERIGLFDTIVLERNPSRKIRVFCEHPDVPCNDTNICHKAARMLQKEYKVPYGVDIHIQKIIPVAAGLAGGSGNAAVLLLGLNQLWDLGLGKYALIEWAKQIGSDVPFFLYDVSFAFATGRGDEIQPLPINHHFWHVLAVPDIKIYTKDAYRNLRLTNPQSDVNILIHALRNKDIQGISCALYNCLEGPSLKLDEEGFILGIKKDFQKANRRPLMTGSGPAVFSISNTRKEAQQLAKKLKHHGEVFVVSTF